MRGQHLSPTKKVLDRPQPLCYNRLTKEKERDKKMKKYNLWKSIYTNEVYEMPVDWLPKFGGWELIGTIEK